MNDAGRGIYVVRVAGTDKAYVGSAMSLSVRWQRHRAALRAGRHCNPHLQRAWDKYGEDAFSCEALEFVVDPMGLIRAEQRWIDEFNPDMNICRQAGSTLGLKPSDRAKAALALGPASRIGKPVTAETREKIAAVHRGKPSHNRGKPLTDEQKAVISAAKKGKPWSDARRAAQKRRGS